MTNATRRAANMAANNVGGATSPTSSSTSSQSRSSTGPTLMRNADGSSYYNNYVSSNPKDAPGYTPGSSSTDKVGPITTQSQAIQSSLAPQGLDPKAQLDPKSPAPQGLLDQTNQLQAGVDNLAKSKGLTLQKNAQGGYSAIPNESAQRQQGLALANQSGVTASPNAGGGLAGAAQFMSAVGGQNQTSPSLISSSEDLDPKISDYFVDYDDFRSSDNQRVSLIDEYKNMSKSLGLDEINADLIDAEAIIDGTEDDIRNEITAAGGLATDSQVQAMGNARNKSLIKNYNKLISLKSNITTQLSTLMQLSVQDRQFAEAEFDRKLNFAFKVAEFKERATTNAKNTYMSLGEKMGFDTLFNSMSPNDQSIAQRVMGITPQQAQQLALRSREDRMMALAKEQAQTKLIEAQTNSANRANQPDGDIPTVKSINGADMQWNPSTKKWEPIKTDIGVGTLRTAQAEQDIQLVEGLISDKNIRTAVGPTGLARFIGRGFDSATGGRQNFIAGVEQLRSQLSLDSLIDAKARGATFGALSEGELKVLSSSASKLGTWAKKDGDGNVVAYNASEVNFKKELEKINNFAKLDYILKGGDPTSVGATIMPNGVPAVRNSDGTYTELQ